MEDIKAYADYLESQLFRMRKEMAADNASEDTQTIRVLALQQDRMFEDLKAIHATLDRIAISIHQLGILEQKHIDATETIKRAHKRIDNFEYEFKQSFKEYQAENKRFHEKYDKRITDLELHNAKNIWIERMFMAIAIAVATVWAKGGI